MEKTKEIEKYNTLERRMKKDIKSNSKKLFDAGKFKAEMEKIIGNLKRINWDNVEHFQMEPTQEIPDSQITEIVTKHYSERGYRVSIERPGIFIAEREKDSLMINISNFRQNILASVAILCI
ncbi:MAG: hypothetical protein U9Q16_02290 [Patescibacteria group bacterium]|nr:hypothetical protein [Patescibacteria group bacterium]